MKHWLSQIFSKGLLGLSPIIILGGCALPNVLISKDCDELANKLLRLSYSQASENQGAYISSLFVGSAFSPQTYEGRSHAILSTGVVLQPQHIESSDYLQVWRDSEAVTGASVAVNKFPPEWPRVFSNTVPKVHSVSQIVCIYPPVSGASGIIGSENWYRLSWSKI